MKTPISNRPLYQKLGLKDGQVILLVNVPEDYDHLLGGMPDGIRHTQGNEQIDFIHIFAADIEAFESSFFEYKDRLFKNGMIWISRYKKSSGIPTDLTANYIREVILALGMVDVKVCSISADWSGLKIMWRIENR